MVVLPEALQSAGATFHINHWPLSSSTYKLEPESPPKHCIPFRYQRAKARQILPRYKRKCVGPPDRLLVGYETAQLRVDNLTLSSTAELKRLTHEPSIFHQTLILTSHTEIMFYRQLTMVLMLLLYILHTLLFSWEKSGCFPGGKTGAATGSR